MKRIIILTIVIMSTLSVAWSQQQNEPKSNASTIKTKESKPEDIVAPFLDSCSVGGNYKALCCSQIDQSQLQNTITAFNRQSGLVLVASPDKAQQQKIYAELKGEGSVLPENLILLKIIKIDQTDRDNPIKDQGIYSIVRYDPKNNKYCIAEFIMKN